MRNSFSLEKMRLRLIIIVVMCWQPIVAIYGQAPNPYAPKVNIPSSPEAALLGRFGDIPIGYYTGTANISIPIYNIKEDGVEIPITLSYHSSGVKVDDQATWVGLGWDLSPEGTIIQEIRGKADEDDFGPACSGDPYYSLFQQRTDFMQSNSYAFFDQMGRTTAANSCLYVNTYPPPYDGLYQDPYCAIDALRQGIGQPDIYNYNFGGYSGKFYIHPVTHAIVLMDKKDEIFFEKTSYNNITATTLDGTVYNFGVIETAHGGIVTEYSGKTYKVNEITLLNGKSIEFTYSDHQYTDWQHSESAEITTFGQASPLSSNDAITYHAQKTLSRITTEDAFIDFNLENRDDINLENTDDVKRLKSIDITSRASNNKIKTVEFSYTYFPYNGIGGSAGGQYTNVQAIALGKRLKLDAVKEIGYENNVAITTHPPYFFEYDMNVIMPMKNSFAKDFWGYYNGEYNVSFLPDLDFFDYFNDPEYKPTNLTLTYPYTGAKRYTDNTKAGAYLLKKITYPTGGFTEFQYEPNSFTNQFIPNKQQIESFTKNYVAVDNSIEDISSNIQFKLHRATRIHFENHINNGAGNYNNLPKLTAVQMAQASIKFWKFKYTNGVPTIIPIKTWDMTMVLNADFDNSSGATWIEDIDVPYDADPDPYFVYHVSVDFPNNLNNVLYASIAGVTSNFNFYDYSPAEVTQTSQCGMRIKTIKSYTATGILASHKALTYMGGKLLNKFHPLTVYHANDLQQAGVNNGNGFEYIAFYNKITASGNDFGTNGGNLIGYDTVEEAELVYDPSIQKDISVHGKSIYYYYNIENQTHQGCPNIPFLRNGLITKEEVYDNAQNKLLDKQYTYTYLQPFPERYVCMNLVTLSTGSLVPCENWTSATPYTTAYYEGYGVYNTSQYGYNVYTLNSEWTKLGTVTTHQYFNPTTFSTTTEAYTYNTQGSINALATVNSKGESLVTKYFYPTDHLGSAYVDNTMITLHNTGTPTITEKWNGTKLLTRQRTVYGAVTGALTLMPQYIYSQIGSFPEERKLTINSYDDKGNITQYTPEDDNPVSFVWNADKTVPLAKVENATIANIGSYNASTIRTNLPNARVTSYTYKPLIGVITITDPNNKTVHYEYDAFNRLSLIRDQDNNIIKKICYNYAGQPEDCPISSTNSEWASTGNTRCQPCPENSQYLSGVREHEEKDINPQSSTPNAIRWVSDGPGTCVSPADWQNTQTSCELNNNGQKTGNQIVTQQDVNPCSLTHGQTRLVITPDPENCPPDILTCGTACVGPQYKCIDGVCTPGTWEVISTEIYPDPIAKKYSCHYAYCFPDGTISTYRVITIGGSPCTITCY